MLRKEPPARDKGIPATPDAPKTLVSPDALAFLVYIGTPIYLATKGNFKVYLSLVLHSEKPVTTVAVIHTGTGGNPLR